MNIYNSVVDIAAAGAWVSRTRTEEHTRDERWLLCEISCAIEQMLEQDPDNAPLQCLRDFLDTNTRILDASLQLVANANVDGC